MGQRWAKIPRGQERTGADGYPSARIGDAPARDFRPTRSAQWKPGHFGVAVGSLGEAQRRRHLLELARFPSSAASFPIEFGR